MPPHWPDGFRLLRLNCPLAGLTGFWEISQSYVLVMILRGPSYAAPAVKPAWAYLAKQEITCWGPYYPTGVIKAASNEGSLFQAFKPLA